MSDFIQRHIGPSDQEISEMLKTLGYSDLETFISDTLPDAIKSDCSNSLEPMTEKELLDYAHSLSKENRVFKSYIGSGYYNTITPSPILRNVFQNPGWYTAYTPYQAEISQGRLEALVNFQTMVCDLTGMEVSNSSLLDEGTALAEAASMALAIKRAKDDQKTLFVEEEVFTQSLNVLKTRMIPLGVKIETFKFEDFNNLDLTKSYAVIFQSPNKSGEVLDLKTPLLKAKEAGVLSIVSTDVMSLAINTSPGEMGAEIVVGLTQRFGVPLGYGGPHAAFLATFEKHKRLLPGRVIGASKDRHGKLAFRLALQTREQHIRREKATSNICTAQVLLAVIASMYAVYHGPKGLKKISKNIHAKTMWLKSALEEAGYTIKNKNFFDTLTITDGPYSAADVISKFESKKINVRIDAGETWGFAVDESMNEKDMLDFLDAIGIEKDSVKLPEVEVKRTTDYLTHPTFNSYHTETELMRYVKRLENKDFSLMHGMIPLGSCTMKLNAATEMIPVTFNGFSRLHPMAPKRQTQGYESLIEELNDDLCHIFGFSKFSFQPNAGSQGEYAGLLAIKAYHEANESHRNICLVPSSAHGTNPASAVMAGMKVVVVKSDEAGNVDAVDFAEKIAEHKENLAALMITYPSTHGVFETNIREICSQIHEAGGMVYLDGANMNAMVEVSKPADLGADVMHLNLHKTFCIPHGGGGPGVGPIGVNEKLEPYLPKNPLESDHAVSSAEYGSASILPISWAYIKMMGSKGLRKATAVAILNANYLAHRLKDNYKILYTGKNNHVAHECILDTRVFKNQANVTVDDVAKRLMDYGFHAPTMSWPVVGTLMVEPTESESKQELDQFADAMNSIAKEVKEIENGEADKDNNVLKMAPHTFSELSSDSWDHPYSRSKAGYPLPYIKDKKFMVSVARVDNAHGDRNFMCSCPPLEDYSS